METTKYQPASGDGVNVLLRAGFDDRAIARMQAVKQRYAQGEYSDLTPEVKRLEFARWLYLNQKIQP